jgi:hypothetical protein
METQSIATCIGCGCTDRHACHDEATGGPCSWLVVDYKAGFGVCSCCLSQIPRWNTGDRTVVHDMAVFKITKEGMPEPYFIEMDDMGGFPILLEAEIGDKFTVEFVKMTSTEFEALPQFDYIRFARQWKLECDAAASASQAGATEKAATHRAEAERLAATVYGLGFNVMDLVNS